MDGFKRGPGQRPTPLAGPGSILPRPVGYEEARIPAVAESSSATVPQPSPTMPIAAPQELGASAQPTKPRKKRSLLTKILAIIFGLVIMFLAVAFVWYQNGIGPRDINDTQEVDVVIKPGASVAAVANDLYEKELIKDRLAFRIYARLAGSANGLKEGACKAKASQSVSEILTILVAGCNEFKVIIFYPGGTIEKPLYKPASAKLDQTMYIKYRLADAGYSDVEIESALNKTYSGPLFEDKPPGSTLEGYVYGETYHIDTGATADQVLQITFDEMYGVLQANDLPQKFTQQGLNMFEAITLASIVQRELNCEGKPTEERKERCYQYQRTIAQIFLKRLKEGDMLGSDVTFIYAADMRGVMPTVDIDSPYNTRINAGLPPGPIASPGLLALKAVGNPTDTDYHYFLAGDDGLIYFAKDLAGHEANIKNHCQQLCNEL